jgi:putative transposase
MGKGVVKQEKLERSSKRSYQKITVKLKLLAEPEQKTELMQQVKIWQEMLEFCLKIAIDKGITGRKHLHEEVYDKLREKYNEHPSHYIYTAITKALGILKSFRKRKRKGKVKKDRPEIDKGKYRLFLDDYHLFTLVVSEANLIESGKIRIATSENRGKERLEIKIENDYWLKKKLEEGMEIKSVELVWKEEDIYAHVVLQKEIILNQPQGIISIDINALTVDVFDWSKSIYVILLFGMIATLRNRYLRIIGDIQKKVKGRKKKKRLRAKYYEIMNRRINQLIDSLSLYLVKYAKRNNLAIALEDLKNIKDKNKIKIVAKTIFNKIIWCIVYKANLSGVKVIKVNPYRTSSNCPVCGWKKPKMDSEKIYNCQGCGFSAHRQLVGSLNVGKKAMSEIPMKSWEGQVKPFLSSGIGKEILRLTEKGFVLSRKEELTGCHEAEIQKKVSQI